MTLFAQIVIGAERFGEGVYNAGRYQNGYLDRCTHGDKMPFVNAEHRESPDMTIPGDRTYIEYRRIMAVWRNNPRWTSVDELAARLYPSPMKRAFFLAFLIFFANHVLDYERLKKEENGDI